MSYRVARIVQPGKSNTKISHGLRYDIRACTVSLAASDTAGFNVCSRAIPRSRIRAQLAAGMSLPDIIAAGNAQGLSACSVACVTNEAGKGAAGFVREPRINLTNWYRENRAEFRAHLLAELQSECTLATAAGQIAACRPNVDSDVPYERTIPEMFALPMQYWDYTKVSKRLGQTPANYHLTYSVNDGTLPADWQRVYDSGCNISVVFDTAWQPGGHANGRKFGQLPTWYTDPNGYRWRVVDGDRSDFRFLDDGPVCVGLRLKGFNFGRMVARMSGFAVRVPRAVRGLFSKIHPAKEV
jgi:hypothetical protein